MAKTIGKLWERFYYDFNAYDLFWNKYLKSKTQYLMLRHVSVVTAGSLIPLSLNFPFNPPFPSLGMCPAGWKGTWVCEPDKHKAIHMYKEWKEGRASPASH